MRRAWRGCAGKLALATRPLRSHAVATAPSFNFARRFDLPTEKEKEKVTKNKYKLPDEPAIEISETKRTVRLDGLSSEDVAAKWPPGPLVAPMRQAAPVERPYLWLMGEDTVSVNDVGRFVKIPRDDLINLLPEGACGELARDLTLIPSRTRSVGLMIRKLAVELIMQLSELQSAVDASGTPRIDKAGFLIDGRKGAGKSQVLNFIAMWARKNGWLTILEPLPTRYAREAAEIKRSNNGIYIQNEFAQQFLEAAAVANGMKFKEIPVNLKVYGSRGIDGEAVKATKWLYDPLIEKTVDREVEDRNLSAVDRLRRIAAYKEQVRLPSMAEQLKNPMWLWDIVEFGLENEAHATQAVCELFLQLQWQTVFPILVIVDEWNECFPVSRYVSIRYDNTRFNGYIPSYHLTMPRLFHRWDGHKYRRGLKICATSWKSTKRRDYRPALCGVKEHQIRTVRNFSQHEFGNFVAYLRLMDVLHNFPKEDLEYYYMLSQGNGWEARRLLSTLY